jgi:hypothetical protein
MPKDLNRPVPPQVVENPSRGPMPGSPILSGGLGGSTLPNTSIVRPVPTLNRRAFTFFQLLQSRLKKTNVDLSGIHVSPYETVSGQGDVPGFNTNTAPQIKASNALALEIADAIIIAARNGDNSTPISGGISGAALRIMRRAIDDIKRSVIANEVRLIGVNSDPAGNADGRPGGQSGGDYGGRGRGGHADPSHETGDFPGDDPEVPPPEEDPKDCCEPVRGVMGIVPMPTTFQETTIHFPRSDCCDDPDITEPNERIRLIQMDVERVPIIEVCQDVKVPPREEEPPPGEDDQPTGPITGSGGGGIGSAGSGGGSGGMGAAGGFSIDPESGNSTDIRAGHSVSFNQYSKPGDLHDPANVGFAETGDPRLLELQAYKQDAATGDPAGERVGGSSSATLQSLKSVNPTGNDSPCRYVIPIPSYEGVDEQPQAITLSPHNTPTDLKKDGFSFAVNVTPLISGNRGPISKAFFDQIAEQVLDNNDIFGSTKSLSDLSLDIADQFAELRVGNVEEDIPLDDLAGAVVYAATDGEFNTNEQRSSAKLILSVAFLDDPRILLVSPNPSRDYRFEADDGNFVPGSNKSNASRALPIAAPMPSGFNPQFNPYSANPNVVDNNDFRKDFQSRKKSSNQGVVRSDGSFVNANNPFVSLGESNDILVDVNGDRVAWQGRLVRDHLDDTDPIAANEEQINALLDSIDQLLKQAVNIQAKIDEATRAGDTATAAALQVTLNSVNSQIDQITSQVEALQHDNRVLAGEAVDSAQTAYDADLSAWNAKYAEAQADPTNPTLQSELTALTQTLREAEATLRAAINEQNQAIFNYTQRLDSGDLPDPNPNGVALPLPFMDLNVNKPIPSFSFESLQAEMKSVQQSINTTFDEAAEFISGLQTELLSGLARYNSLQPAFDRQVADARQLRAAATNTFSAFVSSASIQFGGGISADGDLALPLVDPVLKDGSGNERYIVLATDDAVQNAADIAAINAAFQLAYVSAGLNVASVSGTTDVPPTAGTDLTDDQIATNAGIPLVPQGSPVLSESLQNTLDEINSAVGFEGALLDEEFNDFTRAREMALQGMRDPKLSNAVLAWVRSRIVQLPKKLCTFLFGGSMSSINFEGKEVDAEYRGVLDRIATSKTDRLVQIRLYEDQLVGQKSTAATLAVQLQNAQYGLDDTSTLDQQDPLRIEARRYHQSIQQQLDLANEAVAETQQNIIDTRRGEDSDLATGTSLNDLLVSSDNGDGCGLTMQIMDSLTTQWADGQNTGFEADKRLHLMSGLTTPSVSVNPFYSRGATVAAVTNRFLNVVIGRYKLLRDTVMNTADILSAPMVVDIMPGVIGPETPDSAPIMAIQPLKVVYNRDTRSIHANTGRALGGGVKPAQAYLPTHSLNPDFEYFTTKDIKEIFVAGHSWQVVDDYVVPELLAPGSTYSEIEPNPNAFEVTTLVSNAPFSFDIILTAPDYLSGEITGQALNGFHALMRKFIALFNGSISAKGTPGNTDLNTQLAMTFKYGIYDTFRLPRPLAEYDKVLGSNQAAVSITIPAWNALFAEGYNWGSYGDLYYDIAFKALSRAISWARQYALNVETHLNQSVRGQLDELIENPLDPEDQLDNPNGLDPNNEFDFRIETAFVETPDTGDTYKLDVSVDLQDGYANLDIDGFGYVDSYMAGQLRQDMLRALKGLQLSDNWNQILFGGQQVFQSGVQMTYFMNPLASWDITERPFTNDKPPHIGFTVHLGWTGDAPYTEQFGVEPTQQTLFQYFSRNERPRTRVVRAAGESIASSTPPVFDDSFGGEENITDFDAVVSASDSTAQDASVEPDTPALVVDVLSASDFIGRSIEKFIQDRIYLFMKAVEKASNNSFKGTTLLWPVNYGMISQTKLESLVDDLGEPVLPNRTATFAIGSRQLLVYPVNQEVSENVLNQSTFNNGGGPIATEFQKTNEGVLVTPSKHRSAPPGAMWVPYGSNFGKNIGLTDFVDQVDQVVNVFHAYFGGMSRGAWPGQHTLARVIKKEINTVVVTPVSLEGKDVFKGSASAKVRAFVLGTADDIKEGDEVWLSYDLSKYRKPFVWPSVRSANQMNMDAFDVPSWTFSELATINFIGQNPEGQLDGTDAVGNVFSNLLPALTKRVNQLILKDRYTHVEVADFSVVDGTGEIQFLSPFAEAPDLKVMDPVQEDPGEPDPCVIYARPIIRSITKFGATVEFYDSSTGKLFAPCDDTGAVGLTTTYSYMAVGKTIDAKVNDKDNSIVPTGLFSDKAKRY